MRTVSADTPSAKSLRKSPSFSGSCAQIKAVSRTIFASWVFMQLGQTLWSNEPDQRTDERNGRRARPILIGHIDGSTNRGRRTNFKPGPNRTEQHGSTAEPRD
ncbi:hypothetical protein BVI434_1210027 [Burkholderia vietnamiensis]|nr:hypothetical protein BVI434_1210027 [Burkholderia vietnamiensis]